MWIQTDAYARCSSAVVLPPHSEAAIVPGDLQILVCEGLPSRGECVRGKGSGPGRGSCDNSTRSADWSDVPYDTTGESFSLLRRHRGIWRMGYSVIHSRSERSTRREAFRWRHVSDCDEEDQVRIALAVRRTLLTPFRQLSQGHFSPDNQKKLTGSATKLPIYEAKMTGDTRLVVR